MRALWSVPILILLACTSAPVAAQPSKSVSVRIQVIEAQRKGGVFEDRLQPLRAALEGYEGAKLVDEVETQVEPGSSVSLQILKKSQMLKVTVRKMLPDGTIKLRLAIEAIKFETDTTHQKGSATVLVGFKTDKGTSMFLAVTPKAG